MNEKKAILRTEKRNEKYARSIGETHFERIAVELRYCEHTRNMGKTNTKLCKIRKITCKQY